MNNSSEQRGLERDPQALPLLAAFTTWRDCLAWEKKQQHIDRCLEVAQRFCVTSQHRALQTVTLGTGNNSSNNAVHHATDQDTRNTHGTRKTQEDV